MSEIITEDDNILFFQSPERELAKLREYEEGVDVIHIEILCQNINFPVEEFIKLCEKHMHHQSKVDNISTSIDQPKT
jgi:hypothetical protein